MTFVTNKLLVGAKHLPVVMANASPLQITFATSAQCFAPTGNNDSASFVQRGEGLDNDLAQLVFSSQVTIREMTFTREKDREAAGIH